jgi:hypothetical protein
VLGQIRSKPLFLCHEYLIVDVTKRKHIFDYGPNMPGVPKHAAREIDNSFVCFRFGMARRAAAPSSALMQAVCGRRQGKC